MRERNFYREGQTTHYGQPVKDAGAHRRIWEQLKEIQRVRGAARGDSDNFNAAVIRTRKRGIAITPVKFGISFTATLFNQGGALVLVYRDGSVQVNHGGTEMGQGLYTKIRQIAAEALGLPLESSAHDADAHRQGAEHVGDGRLRGHRSQRRGGARRLPPDQTAPCPVAAAMLECDRKRCASRWARCLRRRRRNFVRSSLRGGLSQAHAALRARLLPHARHSFRPEDGRENRSTISRTARR